MSTQNEHRIVVGDRVRFTLGTSVVQGVIVEDRGPIGAGGVHLYRVSVSNDPYESDLFEMPEDEIETVDQIRSEDSELQADEVMEYLERGGLHQILRAGTAGGNSQARVWLCRDSLGNVTHTFSPERGWLGGASIPFNSLHENRVFTPKRDEVLSFLESFDLSRRQAERVLKSVGTTP